MPKKHIPVEEKVRAAMESGKEIVVVGWKAGDHKESLPKGVRFLPRDAKEPPKSAGLLLFGPDATLGTVARMKKKVGLSIHGPILSAAKLRAAFTAAAEPPRSEPAERAVKTAPAPRQKTPVVPAATPAPAAPLWQPSLQDLRVREAWREKIKKKPGLVARRGALLASRKNIDAQLGEVEAELNQLGDAERVLGEIETLSKDLEKIRSRKLLL